jgi:hypothetical protein
MPFKLDCAVREALDVAVPAVPLEAIRVRERAIAGRTRHRRNAFALAALLLSCAGLAVAAGEHPPGASSTAPVPVASIRPAPTVT